MRFDSVTGLSKEIKLVSEHRGLVSIAGMD
jgi:hypothetical protein